MVEVETKVNLIKADLFECSGKGGSKDVKYSNGEKKDGNDGTGGADNVGFRVLYN